MTTVRADVADMLRAAATYAEIRQQLGVSDYEIARTRRVLRIALPPGRDRRSRAEVAAAESQAVAMLRAGDTHEAVYRATRLSPNRVSELRRQHSIPVPERGTAAWQRTVDEAMALRTVPAEDGHLMWTGALGGRGTELWAEGRVHNARAITFSKHHGRPPEGRLRRTCDRHGCIAGAHLADRRIRQANARADKAFDLIFNAPTSDQSEQ